MICPNCGLPLYPNVTVCPRCGSPTREESSTLSILALVFAFLSPMVGLVLAIVGMVQSREPKNKKRSTVALICSLVAPVVYLILYVVAVFGFMFALGMLGAF